MSSEETDFPDYDEVPANEGEHELPAGSYDPAAVDPDAEGCE